MSDIPPDAERSARIVIACLALASVLATGATLYKVFAG